MFIRKKKIKGRQYYYLVKSVRKNCNVKQEYVEYLGSIEPTTEEIIKLKKKHLKD